MVVSEITGGLGNQMFQYAFGKVLSERLGTSFLLDLSSYKTPIPNVSPRKFELGIFKNIEEKIIGSDKLETFRNGYGLVKKILRSGGIPIKKIFQERRHGYNPEVETLKAPVLLQGYFQSEKYFQTNSALISKQFTFPQLKTGDKNIALLAEMCKPGSVAVHVRRGDYVLYPPTHNFHGLCGAAYYRSAMKQVQIRQKEARFFFFSDEMEWVKEHLVDEDNGHVIVDANKGEDNWKDMYLMSQCNHNIVANSSFSWWGAWLNANPEKIVVAPERWFRTDDIRFEPNDVVPKNWIRL